MLISGFSASLVNNLEEDDIMIWNLNWAIPRDHFLCMRPTNERRRYNVTSSLIGWAHSQNDPWIPHALSCITYYQPLCFTVVVDELRIDKIIIHWSFIVQSQCNDYFSSAWQHQDLIITVDFRGIHLTAILYDVLKNEDSNSYKISLKIILVMVLPQLSGTNELNNHFVMLIARDHCLIFFSLLFLQVSENLTRNLIRLVSVR